MAMAYGAYGSEQQRTGRRGRLIAALLAAAALVLALVLWFAAGKRYGDAVADLAPAPVGCDTTLEFDGAGTYTFFVETKGAIDAIDGDCADDERDYEYDGDALPRVSITLRDDSGDELDLDRVTEPTYDRGGARGEAVRSVNIEEAGDYTLTVDSNVDDVVVRVGRDPGAGVTALRIGAGVAILLAIGLGVLAIVGGRRQPVPLGAPGQPAWQPAPGQAAPVAPPYANAPPNPPYAWPPQQGGPPPRPSPPPPPSGWGRPGSGGPLPPPRP